MGRNIREKLERWMTSDEGKRHAKFWSVIFFISIIGYSFLMPFWSGLVRTVVTGFIFIFIFYINAFYFVPYFLSRKRSVFYIFFSILFLLVLTYLRFLIDYYILGLNMSFVRNVSVQSWKTTIYIYWNINNFVYYLSLIYALNRNWQKEREQHSEVARDKTMAELKLLKQQLNPHFLLNTLNNIYSLSYRGKPNASEMILKLSENMKYMLYESEQEKVALEDELKFLRNYIELNLLKIDEPNQVNWSIKGETNAFKIAPLLLIPLVENAFKYGNLNQEKQQIDISIEISKKGKLLLETTNSVRASPNFYEKSGVGLKNVKKRLELLYPDQYELRANEEGNMFHLKLEIEL